DDIKKLSTLLRKNTKPILIALNKIDIPGAEKNIENLKKEFPDTMFIPCSAESELALREAAKHEIISYIPGDSEFKVLKPEVLSDKQKKALDFISELLKNNGSTGVQQTLDAAVFDFLKYIAVFPGGMNNLSDSKGNVLPDCFLMPPKSTAKGFAYAIHTDFGKHFLYAMDVKKKIRISGDQELKHGDVVEIINAAK
ncbi:MAG: TGS domain-containing protein, partial [Candidatus Aenigmarchaeota archaeon]|nr:TGS domain-containing protein [Candidatus Aenigmarchaeota archaeon]